MQSVTQGLSVTYEARPSAVAEARKALAEFATRAGATAAQVDGVRLAVSEAVTNAVLHAYRGVAGPIHVTAALADRELWILVSDEGGGMQPRADRPGLGLGLGLISQVCDDMAIVSHSSGGVEMRILFKLGASPEPSPPGRERRQPEHTPAPGAAGAPAPAEIGLGLPGPVLAVPA
jgi:anti-sigma regulatory factor (Ser/Thr protein kinase)